MKRLFLNYYLFVILILVLAKFIAIPLVERAASAPFREQFVSYYRELTRGTMYIVSRYLRAFPQQEWPARLQELQPQFGYPLALRKMSPGQLDDDNLAELAAGKIVVSPGYDTFRQRLDGSEYVLVMGPFPSPGVGNAANLLGWIAILVLLGVVVVLWAFPFWRKLSQISRTATLFGAGQLEVRARIPRQSTLAPLAATFNTMAERIEQLIVSQKSLMNAVSHELRTPLTRLRFGLEMMVKATDSQKKGRYLDGIHRDIGEMETLIAELLSYSRFDSKTFTPMMADHSIGQWLQDTVDDLKDEVDAVLGCSNMVEAGEETVRFDGRLLRRAVGNLVHNGAKYGKGRVDVILQKKGLDWLLHVDDDGPGIPEADRARIFEPFSRLDDSRSRDSGGFGLGLAIVKQVAELHGGTVSVSDATLGGSRFTLCLPGEKG